MMRRGADNNRTLIVVAEPLKKSAQSEGRNGMPKLRSMRLSY